MRTRRNLILKSAVIAIASVAGLAFGVLQTVEELPRRSMTLKEFRFLMDEPHTNAHIKQITCIYQQPPVSDDVPYLLVEMRSPRVDCVVSVDQLAGLYEQPDPGWQPGYRLSRLLYAVLGECAYEGIDFRVKEQRMPNFAFAYKYYVRDGKRTKKYWEGLDFMASLTARAFPKSPPRWEIHYTDKQCAGSGNNRNPRYGKGRDSARPLQESVPPVAD